MINNRAVHPRQPTLDPHHHEIRIADTGTTRAPDPETQRRIATLHARLIAKIDQGKLDLGDTLKILVQHDKPLLAGVYRIRLRLPVAIIVCAPDPDYAERGARRLLTDDFDALPERFRRAGRIVTEEPVPIAVDPAYPDRPRYWVCSTVKVSLSVTNTSMGRAALVRRGYRILLPHLRQMRRVQVISRDICGAVTRCETLDRHRHPTTTRAPC